MRQKVTKYNNKLFIFSNEITTTVILLEVISLLKHLVSNKKGLQSGID